MLTKAKTHIRIATKIMKTSHYPISQWLGMRTLSLILLATTTCCCTGKAQGPSSADSIAVDTVSEVTLLFAGDLMQHKPQIDAARQANGTYDYSGVFDEMAPEIQRADIAIGNFEVTLGGPPYKGYPQFCAPDAYLQAAIDCGFDVLTTCNNHSVDTYARGIRRTIQMMDSLGVQHLGTYTDADDRAKKYPFFIERNGIRICLLNYTYGTNGIPVPKPCVVNLIDTAVIARDIAMAKAQQPDVIIAIPHWGDEYQLLPNKAQRELADWLFAQGVDHVIGGHPHVVEPIEVRTHNGNRHVLAYSLGNFVSNQSRPNTDGGTMVRLTLRKNGGKTSLADCGYTLYWVSRPVTSGKRNYRVLPSSYPAEQLNATERTKRDNYLRTTRALFEKYNIGIQEYFIGEK